VIKQTTLGAALAVSLALAAGILTHSSVLEGTESLAASTPEFVVTSDRDAGPGSLRDAILAADRLSSRAHILISAKLIRLDTALPALINLHGIDIEAAAGAGTIDAGNQLRGIALQINSPSSILVRIHIVNARSSGIVINAPAVRLESVTIENSTVGVLVNATAIGAVLQGSTFDHDGTGVMAEADVRDLTILGCSLRNQSRAGIWFVGKPEGSNASPPAASGQPPYRPRMQIVDTTFENDAEGVVANQSISIQRSHFIDNSDAAALILGGNARIGYNDIRGSHGTALSISSGTDVLVTGNTLHDNRSTGILVRDSSVTIERNALSRNGFGVVAIVTDATLVPVIQDNVITHSTADGITLIGGTCLLQHNKILENGGAGVRSLDLMQGQLRFAARPRLNENEVKNNGIDTAMGGIYKLSSSP
jgi:parallel beta-helix repeat protein